MQKKIRGDAFDIPSRSIVAAALKPRQAAYKAGPGIVVLVVAMQAAAMPTSALACAGVGFDVMNSSRVSKIQLRI